MLKVFRSSFIVALITLILGYFWGEYRVPQSGFTAIFVVFFLSILEITLSFDNAVINAAKLEKMTEKWQNRFVTWGILIAVFGMRLIFPIIVVAVFSGLSVTAVSKMALVDVDNYTHYLHLANPSLMAFGGTFLMMIFLSFFFNKEKDVHWIKPVEIKLSSFGSAKYLDILITLLSISILQTYTPEPQKPGIIFSGLLGLVLFLLIDGISNKMEQAMSKKFSLAEEGAKLGFIGFLYLELIDASFSLDGVLGAFAISKDVIIIMLGLATGAMFVRSLTLYFVHAKTLKQFVYLEHGAHWAIGALAIIMYISILHELPEVLTGSVGLVLVGSSFVSSVIYNKNHLNKAD